MRLSANRPHMRENFAYWSVFGIRYELDCTGQDDSVSKHQKEDTKERRKAGNDD